jgi:hypothetical protein
MELVGRMRRRWWIDEGGSELPRESSDLPGDLRLLEKLPEIQETQRTPQNPQKT